MEEDEVAIEPQAMVDKRVIYQGTAPITQVLIRWSHRQTNLLGSTYQMY